MRISLLNGRFARFVALLAVTVLSCVGSEVRAQNPVAGYSYTYDTLNYDPVGKARDDFDSASTEWEAAVATLASVYYLEKGYYEAIAAYHVIMWNVPVPAAAMPTPDIQNGLNTLDWLLDGGESSLSDDVYSAAAALASADAAFKAAIDAAEATGGYPSAAKLALCASTKETFVDAAWAYHDAVNAYRDWVTKKPVLSGSQTVESSVRIQQLINWLQNAYAIIAGYPD